MKPPSGRWTSRALEPLSWLYRAAMRQRNRRYDRLGAAARADVPVISVGNLAVGGTGKTPTVAWLCRSLLDRGQRPAVVSRGYRGRAGAGPVVVSRGDGPVVDAVLAGDEPFMLARALPGVRVVVGSNRVRGAAAAATSGATVVVLDDGFQHRRLHRDLDLVLLDARDPLGNGRTLPAGPLREPPSSLRRAGAILATRAEPAAPPQAVLDVRSRYAPEVPVFRCRHVAAGFADGAGNPAPAPERVVAFCGIARPETFERTLRGAGVELLALESFPDHHRYGASDRERLEALARDRRATLVTTEKDLARLVPGADRGWVRELRTLRIELEIDDGAGLLDLVEQAL